ncbi:MAG: RND family transporter [Lentisphaerae bacterium]|nr:RND family transporter [Lentisphaerota bacterium]
MPFQRRLAAWILDHRVPIVIVILAVTAVIAPQLRRFRVTTSERGGLPEDDPDIVQFEQYYKQFGHVELMIVGLEAEDIFSLETLSFLRHLETELSSVRNVKQTISLASARTLTSEDGEIFAKAFLEEIPSDPAALQALKQEALANEQWVRSIVSEDGKAACINILLDLELEDLQGRRAAVKDVREVLALNTAPGIKTHLTGIAPLITDTLAHISSDLRRFIALTPLVMGLLLYLVFRTLRGVFVPLTVILLSGIWTLGIFFWAGNALVTVTTMLPTLVALICLSDVIHIMAHYYELAATGNDRRTVLLDTMEHMIAACFTTSATTAVGFGSLAVSEMQGICDLGIWTALGIFIAYLQAITLVPILLSFLPLPDQTVQKRYRRSVCSRLMPLLARYVGRDRVVIPVVSLLIVVAAVFGARQLRIQAKVSEHLPSRAPSVEGLAFLEGRMAGIHSFEMAVSGPQGAFRKPWALRELAEIENYLESREEAEQSISPATVIRYIHELLEPEDALVHALPEDEELIDEYWLMLSMSDQADLLNAFVSEDQSMARLCARVKNMGTIRQLELLDDVEAFAVANLDPRLSFYTTGIVKLFSLKVKALVRSQMRTLGVTVMVITVLLVIHLASIRLGLVSMIPTALPALVTLGLMGACGIPLSVATVMISCIAIGISVDNAIHLLVRYRRNRKRGLPKEEAIREAIVMCGQAMVFASLIIAAGFSVLLFSSFGPNRLFGILTAFTMIVALVSDLLLLPYMIRVLHK